MSSRRRVLITGATGMLGVQTVKCLDLVKELDLFTISRHEAERPNHFVCDLTEFTETLKVLEFVKPNVVIHCAALTKISDCEINREYAERLHIESTRILSTFHSVSEVIYMSTDSVFDGQSGNYDENAEVNPLNYYAETKYGGENVLLKSKVKFAIIRTNIIGYNVPSGNSLFEWTYKSLSNNETITGFSNVFFNPLYCGDLALIIRNLVLSGFESRIFHVGSKGRISKYEFLKYVKLHLNLDGEIQSGKLENDPPKIIRPLNTVLRTDLIENLGIVLPSITETIDNLLKDYKEKSNEIL